MAMKIANFKMDRETKGAVRYAEQSPDGHEIIGQLYVRKSGFALAGVEGVPETIQVAVMTGDDIQPGQ